MKFHSCTRCKEPRYPLHKHKKSGVAGVYCDSCIRIIRGYGPGFSLGGIISGFGSWVWSWLSVVAERFFGFKSRKKAIIQEERVQQVRMKAALAKAREIPANPGAGVPQKR